MNAGIGEDKKEMGAVRYSFVIPLKDEEATIVELYNRIAKEVGDDAPFEVIFVDDGSHDGSWNVIRSLVEQHPTRVRGVKFRRNVGKAAGLTAGFRAARGEVVFTLDADLQDDPKEIHRFLAKLAEGYDLVSGWKKVRHDPWHKVLPSRVFNRMLSRFSGVQLHDHNCGFKCYRAEVLKDMTLYGEHHRMVPALAAIQGFKAAEIEVEHHPRRHGVSKYGVERFLRGFMDMLTVSFLRNYRERPSHLIGGVSATFGVFGVTSIALGAGLLLLTMSLPGLVAVIFGANLLVCAFIGFLCGLLAELSIRGGLRHDWQLPIIEDTSVKPGTCPQSRTVVTDISTGYNADH